MNVKGSVLLARRAFVQRHFGREAWDAVLGDLPAEDQASLRGMVLNVGWFPFKLGERLDEAIVKVLGNGDEKVFERIGEMSADENLNGPHRHFLVPGDPQAFLRQTPDIYKFYYDVGHRLYQPTGSTSARLTTYNADTVSRVDCLTVVGWHRRALEMCGARDVQITEEGCRARGDSQCVYRIEWSGTGTARNG
jgi:uncharacterized protein (TIGR02265 family)